MLVVRLAGWIQFLVLAVHSQVSVGEKEILQLDNELPSNDPAHFSFNIDATFATVKNTDGTITFYYSTAAGVSRYKKTLEEKFASANRISFRGTHLKTSSQNLLLNHPDILYPGPFNHFPQKAGTRMNFYFPSIYKISSNQLLAFVHIEDGRGNCYPWWESPCTNFYGENLRYGIGIAYSNDGGDRWTLCNWDGTAESTEDISVIMSGKTTDPNGTVEPLGKNIGGIPFIIKDGFFYVYYNERAGGGFGGVLSVARAPVNDVINNAINGDLTDFRKYDGNDFTLNGLNGLGTDIIPSFDQFPRSSETDILYPYPYYDFHSDAVYSRNNRRYYITVNRFNYCGGDALLLYSSQDGVKWELPRLIDDTPNTYHLYSTFVANSDGSDDFLEVGNHFHVMYPLIAWPHPSPCIVGEADTDLINTDHDDIMLRKITIPLAVPPVHALLY